MVRTNCSEEVTWERKGEGRGGGGETNHIVASRFYYYWQAEILVNDLALAILIL